MYSSAFLRYFLSVTGLMSLGQIQPQVYFADVLKNLCRALVVVLGISAMNLAVLNPAAAATVITDGISTADLASGVSALQLAQDLAGPGISVSNVTFEGSNAQAGRINILDPAVVSFNSGVILSSGDIANVVGPNKSDGITGDMAGSNDADLDALIKDTQTVNPVTYDAASLEFDFVPTADKVYFTYVFGSDEYLEWVNLFNDVFGFYINGQNCATVGTSQAISIDTINDQVNPSLFRDNSYSSPPNQPLNIEMDGLSVELICEATVIPNQTNHIKLAIADTSDQILDSVVMLKAGSFSINRPESCNDGSDNDDDSFVDMSDDDCTNSTTPAPPGQSGVGSGGDAPAFTGNSNGLIKLDAAAVGWVAPSEVLSTSWTVFGINGLTADCTITPSGKQIVISQGVPAVAYADCPEDGEYTARIDGWDFEGGGAWDTELDFFVHQSPPAVAITAPEMNFTQKTDEQIDLAATITGGIADSLVCTINWGDGTKEAGSYNVSDRECTGSHSYTTEGTKLISVTASDAAGVATASAVIISISDNTSPTSQAITFNTVPPTSAAYGDSFTISAAGGASGNPLSYSSSGGCTRSGATFTMTSSTSACAIAINQAGDATYAAATEVSFEVAATKRAVTVTAQNKSKVLGDSDPALTFTVTSGLVLEGDNLGVVLERAAGETVGDYEISQTDAVTNSDYTITYVAGTFTITDGETPPPPPPPSPKAPDAVSKIIGKLLKSGGVSMSWSAPANNGAAITKYEYSWRTGKNKFSVWISNKSARNVVMKKWKKAIVYNVKLRTTNSAGSSTSKIFVIKVMK